MLLFSNAKVVQTERRTKINHIYFFIPRCSLPCEAKVVQGVPLEQRVQNQACLDMPSRDKGVKQQKQKELTSRANSLQFIYSYAMVYRSWRCGVCRLSLGDHSPYVWCVPLHDGDEEDFADSSDVPQHNGRHH